MSKWKAFGANVIVVRQQGDRETKGGIIVPDPKKERKFVGEVVSVGQGFLMDDGTYTPIGLEVGQTVRWQFNTKIDQMAAEIDEFHWIVPAAAIVAVEE